MYVCMYVCMLPAVRYSLMAAEQQARGATYRRQREIGSRISVKIGRKRAGQGASIGCTIDAHAIKRDSHDFARACDVLCRYICSRYVYVYVCINTVCML